MLNMVSKVMVTKQLTTKLGPRLTTFIHLQQRHSYTLKTWNWRREQHRQSLGLARGSALPIYREIPGTPIRDSHDSPKHKQTTRGVRLCCSGAPNEIDLRPGGRGGFHPSQPGSESNI